MLFYQNFNDLRPNQVEETSYARGIAAIEPNLIAIGNSSGSIYLFDIPSKGTNIVMANKIHDKNLNTGIFFSWVINCICSRAFKTQHS